MNKSIAVLFTLFSFFSASAHAGMEEQGYYEENEAFQKNPRSLNGKGCISMKHTRKEFLDFIPCWPEDHDTPRSLEKVKGFKTYTEKGKYCVRTTGKTVSFVTSFTWWDERGRTHSESEAFRLAVDSPKKLCVR
ncbi:MAG: hypothetical protein NUW00_04515 [Candidatus Kaiserbacteria bacterium]|nr:hypothetical protein [Candidatus Kaiserbacteria bacterium]